MLPTLVTILSALIATLFMVSLTYAFVWDGVKHGDMIRLLGTEVTDKTERQFMTGVWIFFAIGLALSGLYYLAINFLRVESFIVSAGIGGAIGFVQGFVLMHWYIYEHAIQHEDEMYSRNWIPSAVVHWFAHMGFGFSMGTLIAAFMLYGMNGFLISALINLVAAGGILLFARKEHIIAVYRQRHTHT
jgi:hypothetical protein